MDFERIYRHGDVILFKLPEHPYGDLPAKKVDRLTLAFGEVTGHAHRLRGEMEVLETGRIFQLGDAI